MVERGQREVIDVDDVIEKGSVGDVETTRVRWSIGLTVLTMIIATGALFYSVVYSVDGLQTWATGLISAIAGAAISYGFNARAN